MIDALHLQLAQRLGELLRVAGLRLVCAESCTGGGLSHAITAIPGSSQWFERGYVTYANDAKRQVLGVDNDTLARFGAVSEETAVAMATGALRDGTGDISVAITGIAGPGGGSPEKPVGTVCVAWVRKGRPARSTRVLLPGGREAVRDGAIALALQGLLDSLESAA